MNIYLHEPRDERIPSLLRELETAGLHATRISETFFLGQTPMIRARCQDDVPVLLADTPGMLEHLRTLRRAQCTNPVVVLRDMRNARRSAEALDAGADDDVVIPVKGVELRSRINSIRRRAAGHSSESLNIGEVNVYFDGRDPEICGSAVHLSPREHAIFQHLATNAEKVVPKQILYDAVYGMSEEQPFDKVIDVYICKLRKKIAAASESGHPYIKTLHGRGYKFAGPDHGARSRQHPAE
ncbi:winged helix-turn-helix domain-containing protein [Litorisediminicola beolgyonensis]|uniref:Winged helix-turn-helix domain-containing protein n=1 Tax=Litorisediminicola beolgyonensis TaxID=1173614 RepID=A0ABW3ZH66_9RHOB